MKQPQILGTFSAASRASSTERRAEHLSGWSFSPERACGPKKRFVFARDLQSDIRIRKSCSEIGIGIRNRDWGQIQFGIEWWRKVWLRELRFKTDLVESFFYAIGGVAQLVRAAES
jgi:hypothetical protein